RTPTWPRSISGSIASSPPCRPFDTSERSCCARTRSSSAVSREARRTSATPPSWRRFLSTACLPPPIRPGPFLHLEALNDSQARRSNRDRSRLSRRGIDRQRGDDRQDLREVQGRTDLVPVPDRRHDLVVHIGQVVDLEAVARPRPEVVHKEHPPHQRPARAP